MCEVKEMYLAKILWNQRRGPAWPPQTWRFSVKQIPFPLVPITKCDMYPNLFIKRKLPNGIISHRQQLPPVPQFRASLHDKNSIIASTSPRCSLRQRMPFPAMPNLERDDVSRLRLCQALAYWQTDSFLQANSPRLVVWVLARYNFVSQLARSSALVA
jgi:hypothetical protein